MPVRNTISGQRVTKEKLQRAKELWQGAVHMKSLSILTRVLVQSLVQALMIPLIVACGAQATPTVNSAEVENTMVSEIVTMLAETHAAIPTATPPPTATVTNTPTPAA